MHTNKYKLCLFFIILSLYLFTGNVFAVQERHALVVGNADYSKNIGALRNPGNDAEAMSLSLQKKGFSVTFLKNAGKRQMEDAFRSFAAKLRTDAVGLFFFAGHAIEVDGENYLIPIGAHIENEVDAKYEAVSVGRLLDNMDSAGNGLNLVVLDACRNNPYSRRFRGAKRGLQMMAPPSGTMILYATEPGNVAADGEGDNGVFTLHLLDAIETPGLSVEEAFKKTALAVKQETRGRQVPWYEGIILGQFSFIPSGAMANDSQVMATAPQINTASNELVFWQSVDSRPTLAGYEAYIATYPNGVFASLARARLTEMKKKPVARQGVVIAKRSEASAPKVQTKLLREPNIQLPERMSLLNAQNQIVIKNDFKLNSIGNLSFYKGNTTENRSVWEWHCILSGKPFQVINKGSTFEIEKSTFSSSQLPIDQQDSELKLDFTDNQGSMLCKITARPGDIYKMKTVEFQKTVGAYIELR